MHAGRSSKLQYYQKQKKYLISQSILNLSAFLILTFLHVKFSGNSFLLRIEESLPGQSIINIKIKKKILI